MSTTELSYTLADVQVLVGTMLNVSIAQIIYAIQQVTTYSFKQGIVKKSISNEED